MNIERIELGEICEFLDSKRVPVTESDRKPGPYPYYGANGQQGWIDGFIFDEPLILLAEDGGAFGSKTRPIAYKVTGKYWVNNHAHVLRPYSNCDLNYLCHILSFYDVTKYVNGTTRQKLTKSEAEQIPIPIPPLPEQRRIAALLDKADRLPRTRRHAAQLSDTFLQAVFVRMFGDPVRNPMGWDVEAMGDKINDIRYGTGSPPEYEKDGIPFIRATNIKNGTVEPKGMAFISRTDADKIAKCKVKKGNLIIVRSGVNAGDCAVIPAEYDGAFAAYDLIVEVPYPQNVYYNCVINSVYGKAMIEPLTRRAGQPHLNAEQIESFRFPFPPLSLQQKFARVVQQFERLRAQQREAERQAEHLFQTLLQKAFNGEV